MLTVAASFRITNDVINFRYRLLKLEAKVSIRSNKQLALNASSNFYQ